MVKIGMTSYKYFLIFWMILSIDEYVIAGGGGNEWKYEGSVGPSHWHVDYPNCGGRKQSPINIDTSRVILNTSLSPFVLNGYERINNVNMSIQNNGHTVEIDLKGESLTISGGGLPGVYKAQQFHFHWGSIDGRGSEHLLNGNHFPMEMHIVHYSSRYSDFKTAMNMTDGLVVLGFLFKIGRENSNMNHVINYFSKISHKDEHVKINTFPLGSLLPKNLKSYYRYYGSLTTPPCYESIIWSIFRTQIEVSENQMQAFRNYIHSNILNQTEVTVSDDYRPVQSLNGRNVYASDKSAIDTSGSNVVYKTSIWIYVCTYIALLIPTSR